MTPTATYRLQLRREFGFREAAAIMPYLARLGVSHVYCSPVLEATPGSAHGYDVVDHTRLSPELGGDDGWAELAAAARHHGLGLVVDVVPNHMALPVPEPLNRAFYDVLRLGVDSPHAAWFDIDWTRHGGRVLVPVLAAPLARCLEAGEITVDRVAREVRYFEHRFPLAPGTDEGAADLAALLDEQHYLLADWRVANRELNYRRFFDVTSLAGLRVEDPSVFAATHRRLLQLVHEGAVDGLRVDHPDGLADPGGYLDALAAAAAGRWTVVEKILEGDESLPADWNCAGTTGYDALTAVSHLLLDPAGEQTLTAAYESVANVTADFDDVVEESKRQVVDQLFPAEVSRLVREAAPLPDAPPAERLEAAITEVLVAFDVYRAYGGDPASTARIDEAVGHATSRRPDLAVEIGWLAGVLHRRHPDPAAAAAVAVRFEQTTGPVMAKGVEDTAFYRYHRLTALNEVGGSPGSFGLPVEQWHERCTRMAAQWPDTMTTLSTHDTKRSEDVRARLLVLAEIPEVWSEAVATWRSRAARHGPPDANTDYLFWQTLVGAWPIDEQRMAAYVEKATREAKQHTSWTAPDESYDRALRDYVGNVFADDPLLADVADWVERQVSGPADSNMLAQKLVQLTMPGVPDVYQGQELTARWLVDPDNRRPVDYAARAAALEAVDNGLATLDAERAVDPKLRVTATALRCRRDQSAAFQGAYVPVRATGAAAEHVVAFGRGGTVEPAVVTVATRLPAGLSRRGGWGDTTLTGLTGSWRDLVSDRPVGFALGDILAELPVALLVRDAG